VEENLVAARSQAVGQQYMAEKGAQGLAFDLRRARPWTAGQGR